MSETQLVNKKNLIADLKISSATVDIYMGKLRKDNLIESLGNGYWRMTEEGRRIYENDPLRASAITKPKDDDSRLFSLSPFIDYIEHDFYCQVVLEGWDTNLIDPDMILPLVIYWLKCTNQMPKVQNKSKDTKGKFGDAYADAIGVFINALVNITHPPQEEEKKEEEETLEYLPTNGVMPDGYNYVKDENDKVIYADNGRMRIAPE